MRRKKGHSGQAQSSGDGRLTPTEIQQVEFRLAFRGYNERDVDAFLDRITEDLSTYIEENQGLRSGAGASPPETMASGKGSEAAAREAEGIVARAKERAAQIVRDAEAVSASASAGGPSAGAGATDPRAAIAPFLSREREFLQSLGGLVQDHAEEIKGLVLAHRKKAGSDARAVPTVSASDAPDPGSGAAPEPEPEPERDRREAAPPQPLPVPRPEPVVPTEEVVRTEEMEPARTGEPEPVPAEPPSGERSLRDLFWGED